MGDQVDRLEVDRILYAKGNRQQLVDLISKANPSIVAGAISKALELQLITEELARESGMNIDESAIEEYCSRDREGLQKQVDLAVNQFICSIVSQEG